MTQPPTAYSFDVLQMENSRGTYAITTLQDGTHQMRFIASLSERKVKRWLTQSIQSGRILITVNVTGTDKVASTSLDGPFPDSTGLLKLLTNQPVFDQDLVSAEAILLLQKMMEPNTVPTNFPGIEVDDVQVVAAFDWLSRLSTEPEPEL